MGRTGDRPVSWRLGRRCCSRTIGRGNGGEGCACTIMVEVCFGSDVLVIRIGCSCDRLRNFFCIPINLLNKKSRKVDF